MTDASPSLTSRLASVRDGRAVFAALLALVISVAAVSRWIVCGLGLPYLHRWGEPNIAGLSLQMVKTGDPNPHWFNYGTLTIYLHCVVDVFHYLWLSIQPEDSLRHIESLEEIRTHFDSGWRWTISHPSFYYWNRVLTGLFGAGVVCITYVLGRVVSGRWTGLAAACLLAASTYHIEVSTTIRVDVPGSFWSITVVALSLAYLRRDRTKYLVTAFVLTGLAAATKYNLVLVGLVPLAVLAMSMRSNASAYRPRLWAAAFLLPPLAFVLAMPYALLDFSTFIGNVRYEMEHYNSGGQGARTVEAGLPHLLVQFEHLAGRFGWAVVTIVALGVTRLATLREGRLVLLFPLVFVFFMTRTVVAHEHNFIAIYPFIGVAFGCGLLLLHAAASRISPPAAAGIAVTTLVAGVLWTGAGLMSSVSIWSQPDTRSAVVDRVNELAAQEGWKRVLIVSQLRMHDEDFLRLAVEAERIPIAELPARATEFDAVVSPASFDVAEGQFDDAEFTRLSRRAERWSALVPTENIVDRSAGNPILLGRPAANPEIVITTP